MDASSLSQARGASPALPVQGRFLSFQGLPGATPALCSAWTTIFSDAWQRRLGAIHGLVLAPLGLMMKMSGNARWTRREPEPGFGSTRLGLNRKMSWSCSLCLVCWLDARRTLLGCCLVGGWLYSFVVSLLVSPNFIELKSCCWN